MRTILSLLRFSEVKPRICQCTPCRLSLHSLQEFSGRETTETHTLPLIDFIHSTWNHRYIHMTLKQMHNKLYKQTVSISFNRCKQYSSQHHEIGSKIPYFNPSAYVHGFYSINYLLIQLLQSLFFYALLFSCSTTLFLLLRIMIQYNTFEGDF